ncbi:S-type anion channel SLAH1 [Heracleum sosnowskyi]|uniref:S-type anion channel SLAH1 n=1 Tax=Heracleum sosnowskyi TaxID=360622 RepID=A0AAD8ND42_9APIA|nr:S-type anion channel SLAH1 [Heracleum sosnowskyi]
MRPLESQSNIQLVIIESPCTVPAAKKRASIPITIKSLVMQILTQFHAGYFRITLSICSQALLWKNLREPPDDAHVYRRMLNMLPSAAFILLWSLAFLTLVLFSTLYILKCFYIFESVNNEFLNHVGVNYLFAPWISWLLLLQSVPFFTPNTLYYLLLWWIFIVPIVALDVKIYGQWFTEGKKFLSTVANPASQLSVIGNLVGARAAAEMGWTESAICIFSLGMVHYLVLFVTLYQRLSGSDGLPAMLRPVFFLFIAAPSMASLTWISISGKFDYFSKMLFFLSLFLFISLICRPNLFKKSMRKFNVAWWAYSYPITILALSSTEYAHEVKSFAAYMLMMILSACSVLVILVLMVFSAINADVVFRPCDDLIPTTSSSTTE